ncbi:MAG: AmmeMemoRadiSam system protein A [Spirochaetales bacterium]|nr:AmmeMemoRadiSam system protein A [Spirochaetales bacterium]
MEFTLSDKEKKILLTTARESIGEHLFNQPGNYPEPTRHIMTKCGAFVTLHIGSALRGCIGYVIPVKPLYETVKDVAVSSAFQDPRFPPLRRDEFDRIEIEISALSPLSKITDISEIKVGLHGIMIKRGFSSGLLLPQVAVEQNWDLETFLTNTCYKAGLNGNCWKQSDTEIEIFSAIVFSEKELQEAK